MRAAIFNGAEKLDIMDVAIPPLGAKDVQIKVHACGVCGTDLHIYHGDEGAAPTPLGTALGHEFAGEVVAVGAEVTAFSLGDRVCIDPNKLCGECAFCKDGIGHFCENMVGIGTTVHGGFAQYCTVPQSQVYRFGENLSYEEAAMTEPVGCCMHGIDLCQINCGDTVMVIGGGMIGLIMLQLAKLRGAATLILLEPIAEKRELAQSLGADLTIDPITEDVEKVLALHQITRVSTVIECVGKPQTIQQAIGLAGKYSTVMMFGLTKPEDEIAVKPFEIFKKEITLKASFINPYTHRRALALIESKKIDVRTMIHKVATLDELPNILGDKSLSAAGKYIINPQA